MDSTLTWLEELRDELPQRLGAGTVAVSFVRHGIFHQLVCIGEGPAPAPEVTLSRVVHQMEDFAQGDGGVMVCPAVLVSGGRACAPAGSLVVPGTGFALHAVARGAAAAADTRTILEAVRGYSEHSVTEVTASVDAVVKLATGQLAELEGLANHVGETSGVLAAIEEVEGQLKTLDSELAAELVAHRNELSGAGGWATDITRLARGIDEIAQSARLLTFNAKVESARIGDQGRGFLVIASAISELAQNVRSSNDVVQKLAQGLARTLPSLRSSADHTATKLTTALSHMQHHLAELRAGSDQARLSARESLGSAQRAAEELRERTGTMLEHLQFQDRASQLLDRASSQVAALMEGLAVSASGADVLERVGELGRKSADDAQAMRPGEVQLF